MEHKGLFITVEHADGVGGTTFSRRIVEMLRNKQKTNVVRTYNPGDGTFGREIRRLLGLSGETPWVLSKEAELFLYEADRAQNHAEVIRPALQRGEIVICDRYLDSTLVYQGRGRGFSEHILYVLHRVATESLIPDLTVIVTGESRRDLTAGDRFERDSALQSTVSSAYLDLATTDSRYLVVDSKEELTVSLDQIWHVVEPKIQALRIL